MGVDLSFLERPPDAKVWEVVLRNGCYDCLPIARHVAISSMQTMVKVS